MCGNWRRTEGLTKQEKIAEISEKEQWQEYIGE
jgi:hypothetical protein